MAVSIYDYLDYHDYLKDWLEDAKNLNPKTSYQSLANKAGIKSRGYVYKIFSGKGNLNIKSSVKLVNLLQLTAKEVSYFIHLIHLKHAKSETERSQALGAIEQLVNYKALSLEHKQFVYFHKWYHPVVREMVCHKNFKSDFNALAKMIIPNITVREARESVNLLLSLNLIKRKGSKFVQTDTVLKAQSENDYIALRAYQKEMMTLGQHALDFFNTEERHIVSITAGVSNQGYNKITDAVKNFKKQLGSILQHENDVEKTCQINIQLFPLSQGTSN